MKKGELFSPAERAFASAAARLAVANPFLPERVELEQQALGAEFKKAFAVWSAGPEGLANNPNVPRLEAQAAELAKKARQRLREDAARIESDLRLYESLVELVLYATYAPKLHAALMMGAGPRGRLAFYGDFRRDVEHFLAGLEAAARREPAHLFACFFQIRRAFHVIFTHILGSSMPAARLRAEVWQSIFSHDMGRYRRTLYRRMEDVTTLITGPSGTGKELVARAVARSGYLPFDEAGQRFAAEESPFIAVNLSALSPSLVESELFGHKRGAFTGAIEDRAGWLEACGPGGAVFLDEIGEVDMGLQVKLLRVLETRELSRIGESRTRRFGGKLLAATNRDLGAEVRQGRFREDLYYRLCGDLVRTPPLHERLRDRPEELHTLVMFLARRSVGDDEAERLATDVERYIDTVLGRGYGWPGNVRELEQCVRNVLIRGRYEPAAAPGRRPESRLLDAMAAGTATADELLRHYVTSVYAKTGSYEETARRLDIDRRTAKSRVDLDLLKELRGS